MQLTQAVIERFFAVARHYEFAGFVCFLMGFFRVGIDVTEGFHKVCDFIGRNWIAGLIGEEVTYATDYGTDYRQAGACCFQKDIGQSVRLTGVEQTEKV